MSDQITEAELEKEIVHWAMKRLKSWKRTNTLIPRGKPGAMKSIAGFKMIKACLKLDALRKTKATP